MKQLVLALCAIALISTSCKKDKDDKCDVTKENLVGSYKIITLKFNGEDWLEDCQKDDILTLNANNTYTIEDAGTECDPNGDDSGSWMLESNTLIVEGTPIAVPITSFDCKTVSGSITEGGMTFEVKLQKQ